MSKITKFIISLIIPLLVGFGGSFFTRNSLQDWYATLNKPIFNLPGWLFAPVWTLLYILIGIAFYLVWINNFGQKRETNIGIYAIQLILNLLWSVFFFGLKNPLLALVDIVILWFLILANIIVFSKVSKTSGRLLIPYLLWVSFATLLNFSIFVLNRG